MAQPISSPVHGLDYDPTFISALPVLEERPSPHAPIRSLNATQFADVHTQYLLSHAPDSVIFPFLHGLEGNNEAQNMFFASAGMRYGATSISEFDAVAIQQKKGVQVPRFRGLVWVAAEDEDDHHHGRYFDYAASDRRPSLTHSEDDDEDQSINSSSDDDDLDEMEMDMDLDIGEVADADRDRDLEGGLSMDLDETMQGPGIPMSGVDGQEGKHMHPVNSRHSERIHAHALTDRRTSTSTECSSSSCDSAHDQLPSPTLVSSPIDIPSTHDHHFISSDSQTPPDFVPSQAHSQDGHTQLPLSPSPSPSPTELPILTSSFTARELLKPKIVADSQQRWYNGFVGGASGSEGSKIEWEFVDAKVPDGISLRNFGIQTPVYATVSDIVIYSPRGNTSSALALAEKFKQAIEAKYNSRCQTSCTPPDELVTYNVFVLDASPDEIHETLEYMVMRVEDSLSGARGKAYTDGTDAHTRRASDPNIGITHANDSGAPVKKKIARANTVNFAQREKDEMRDLTRASEVWTAFPSGHPLASSPSPFASSADKDEDCVVSGSSTASLWDPSLGQIFLGNTGDVPAPTEAFDQYGQWNNNNARSRPRPSSSRSPARSTHSQSSSHPFYEDDYEGLDDMVMDDVEEGFMSNGNDPKLGYGYDICIECDDMAPFPTAVHMRAVEEHVKVLDAEWVERCLRKRERSIITTGSSSSSSSPVASTSTSSTSPHPSDITECIPSRPPPHPADVVHMSFPSSVAYATNILPFVSWLESLIRPVEEGDRLSYDFFLKEREAKREIERQHKQAQAHAQAQSSGSKSAFGPRSLPPPSAFNAGAFLPASGSSQQTYTHTTRARSTSATYLHTPTSSTPSTPTRSPVPSSSSSSHPVSKNCRTRPLKILIYSQDGYTESSSLALTMLMAFKGLNLPEAYLELQVGKKRSFFVYQNEVGALKRVESRLEKEREKGTGRFAHSHRHQQHQQHQQSQQSPLQGKMGRKAALSVSFACPSPKSLFSSVTSSISSATSSSTTTTTSAISTLSAAQPASAVTASSSEVTMLPTPAPTPQPQPQQSMRRPRASTLPVLPPSLGDHQVWFNDPRFDGSFPSRVLPFLYLGNLAHASNAYMLHALGITHVVSVGECALVPPPSHTLSSSSSSTSSAYACGSHSPPPSSSTSSHAQFIPGKGPGNQGSLWIEEREGRIKVLDIKGVCDDGIDTLEPQLEPICEWIDRARMEGGKVLVHCRVGVSRSATVTIAYVMKHLNMSLVDAYLIVRSRRLSVLIQPNMRLLYNLLGWEVKLAKERAMDSLALTSTSSTSASTSTSSHKSKEEIMKMRTEMAKCLNWPYLAREVHLLNEKYLH